MPCNATGDSEPKYLELAETVGWVDVRLNLLNAPGDPSRTGGELRDMRRDRIVMTVLYV